MKKISILVIIACLFFIACKKDTATPTNNNDATSTEKSYVSINITDFVRKVDEFPKTKRIASSKESRDTALQSKVRHIYFRVYDKNTQALVVSLDQSYVADTAQFGRFSDSLRNGQYIMIVVAATDSLSIVNNNNLSALSLIGKYKSHPVEAAPWPDVFAKKYTFAVGQGSTVLNLELERIVGKLEVHLADANYQFYRTTITMQPDFDQFDLNASLPKLANPTPPILTMKQTNDTTFSSLVMNTTSNFSVKISVYNVVTGLVVEKIINNVRCYTNRKTIISGKIVSFDPNLPFGIADIKMQINDVWENGGPTYNY